MNKGEKLGQLASRYSKLLEIDFTQNGVKSVYNVHLKHHPIRTGIQNGSDTMYHDFITSSSDHLKLIW
jgi:hypothetical protein